MELERFWRWTMAALVAFGVMLVSAGILGTWCLLPEREARATDREPALTKADGAEHPSQHGWEWSDSEKRAPGESAERDGEGEKGAPEIAANGRDGAAMGRRQEVAPSAVAGKSVSGVSGRTGQERGAAHDQPGMSTNRTTAVQIAPRTEVTSGAVSGRGGDGRTLGGGDEKRSSAATTVQALDKNGSLLQGKRGDAGRSDERAAAETEASDEDEEDEELD